MRLPRVRLPRGADGQDLVGVLGLGLLAAGVWYHDPGAALIVTGAILLRVGGLRWGS